jgi:hypothetical protein
VAISTFDPFDLPEWLGIEPVTWQTDDSFADYPLIRGHLVASDHSQPLDLRAVDAAYPRTICPPQQRHDAHQAWHYGQVLLLRLDDRVAAAAPGTRFDANLVVETVRRLAKALGAPGTNFTVLLTL